MSYIEINTQKSVANLEKSQKRRLPAGRLNTIKNDFFFKFSFSYIIFCQNSQARVPHRLLHYLIVNDLRYLLKTCS